MFLVRVHIGGLVFLAVVTSDKAEANTEEKEEDCVGSHVACQWCSDDKFSHTDSFIENFIREVQMNAYAYSLHLLQADSWEPLEETGAVI